MPKTTKLIQSFNAGELSPLMDARIDQEKYVAGCRTMENFIPLIYGGAERRPGTQYIAGCKSNDAKSRLVAFEHSVDDTYVLEFANQAIRVFRSGGRVLTNTGTETISALDNRISHWKMNDNAATTTVADAEAAHNATLSTNTQTVHVTGKTGTGCFNLDNTYAAEIDDHDDFTFIEGTNGDFSIAGWAYITNKGSEQVVMSKWSDEIGSEGREWKLSVDESRKLKFSVADESLLLDSDLIAHWKLNDNASSNTVVDARGSHNGALVDGSNNYTSDVHATGKVGTGCFDLNATAYVGFSDHNDLSFGNGAADSAFSIAGWVYVALSASSQTILSKWNWGVNTEWLLYLQADETMRLHLYDKSASKGIYETTDAALTAGWHFVAATYDGSSASSGMTLYVDGDAVASTGVDEAGYVAMENTTTTVLLGANRTASVVGSKWNDKLDNIMLFNKELSAAEVTALYNSGSGNENLNTVHPYKLSDDALDTGWRFVAVTYEGENGSWSGATALNYATLYVDGSAVDATATNLSTYVKMENTAAKIRIGASYSTAGAIEKIWNNKLDNLFITSDKLSAAEISALITESATYEVTAPYLTADLFELKFEHSADVMYITHPDYEPRKLSRTGHDDWSLEALDLQKGPFRDENDSTSATIAADGTTGSVTLTATGCAPFVSGTTSGHLPSGALETSKSQTGALFKLVHALGTSDISDQLQADVLNDATTTLNVYKGVTWDFVTNGTWGGNNDPSTIVLERSYDSGTTYETVVTVTSAANHNAETSGTEESADAIYRARVSSACAADTEATVQISVRDTAHIGIVEITAVASPTSATATVLTTLASTNGTHRWSEGAFSNYRGWPATVRISPEERLTFGGNASQPLETWGSVIGDFEDFTEGSLDDDAITFPLIGSGQQNQIRWILARDTLIFGTEGGEHLLGASSDEEALTPSNVKAKPKTTYGSSNVDAIIINTAVLFLQRGGRKIREFLYNFENDDYKADDLTVFSHHITESGIVDMAFQRTPDPTLWCVRDDGEMAVMTYEKDQNVFSWARYITSDSTGDSNFESVAVIYGGEGEEDEVWVTVERTINSSTVRYIERFYDREMPADMDDMKYLDCALTYDSTATTTITGLDHLEGESVDILADGEVQTAQTVSSGSITIDSASTVCVGLGYTSTLKPMKIDLASLGLGTKKRIVKAIVNFYQTINGTCGRNSSNMDTLSFDTDSLYSGHKELTFPGEYEREGDIIIQQTDPLPMTVLSVTLDVVAHND